MNWLKRSMRMGQLNSVRVNSDYISSLEGFRNVGELLVALHSFAREKFYPKNPKGFKDILSAESIISFVKLRKSGMLMK